MCYDKHEWTKLDMTGIPSRYTIASSGEDIVCDLTHVDLESPAKGC